MWSMTIVIVIIHNLVTKSSSGTLSATGPHIRRLERLRRTSLPLPTSLQLPINRYASLHKGWFLFAYSFVALAKIVFDLLFLPLQLAAVLVRRCDPRLTVL